MTAADPAPDVVVIGAGIIGAACALYAARAGFSVTVVDSGTILGGTSGAGEGNLLVSDKEQGPELDLALRSLELWRSLVDEGLGTGFEYEPKGGLVVAFTDEDFAALRAFAAGQKNTGVIAEEVEAERLPELEPHLAPGLAGGYWYPQDSQVMPALATAQLVAASGADVRLGTAVTGLLVSGGTVRGVRTTRGDIPARFVVNAAGAWSEAIAALAGSVLPMQPRRGFVLVTEPLPPWIRHKVYSASYVSEVASGDAALQSSAVIEGTPSGPVLIGASRELVGLDRTPSYPALGRLAAQAAELFPFLERVSVQRYYCGFRPFLPDHLPAVGPDANIAGLFHACGHEGAGIGLAPATGELIAALLAGEKPALDAGPFQPARFETRREETQG
ncbi:MAG: FAD-binding oxidoreductase [Catenulispora sp.]|nr:FAD-binding oxidoreductase [Catenulispora sp.]